MKFRSVARIVKPYGRKGCVQVELILNAKFQPETKFFLAPPLPDLQFVTLSEVLVKQKHLVFCFHEVNDIAQAEQLRGRMLQSDKLQEKPFNDNLIDYEVMLDNGEKAGRVKDVIESSGYRVIVVTDDRNETLVPLVDEYVIEIEDKKKRILLDSTKYDELKQI